MFPINAWSWMLTAAIAGSPQAGLTAYESKFYILETDLPGERAKFIGQLMDATGQEYDRRFQGFRGVVRQKPRLKVFADRDRYLGELRQGLGDSNAAFTAGLFSPRDGIVYAFEQRDLEHTLKHECFHQFAHHVIGGRMPAWLNEGLAEYFAEGVFDDKTGQLRLGEVPKWRAKLLRAAREKKATITVDQLLHLGRREWNDNLAGIGGAVQYTEAWVLCHFLVHADGGQYQKYFDQYLREIDKGMQGDAAFKIVFGADLNPLQIKLDTYTDQLIATGLKGAKEDAPSETKKADPRTQEPKAKPSPASKRP